MTPLRICLDYLDSFGVCYRYFGDAALRMADQLADAALTSAKIVAETVVLKGDAQFLLVVVPAESYVEIGKVRAVVRSNNLRFATRPEVSTLFPYGEVEWVPPLGGLVGAPIYLDREIADQETFAFNAFTRRDRIHIRTEDFQRIARPVIGSFTETDYQKEFRSQVLKAKAAGA